MSFLQVLERTVSFANNMHQGAGGLHLSVKPAMTRSNVGLSIRIQRGSFVQPNSNCVKNTQLLILIFAPSYDVLNDGYILLVITHLMYFSTSWITAHSIISLFRINKYHMEFFLHLSVLFITCPSTKIAPRFSPIVVSFQQLYSRV